jgi:hypothetical protein
MSMIAEASRNKIIKIVLTSRNAPLPPFRRQAGNNCAHPGKLKGNQNTLYGKLCQATNEMLEKKSLCVAALSWVSLFTKMQFCPNAKSMQRKIYKCCRPEKQQQHGPEEFAVFSGKLTEEYVPENHEHKNNINKKTDTDCWNKELNLSQFPLGCYQDNKRNCENDGKN